MRCSEYVAARRAAGNSSGGPAPASQPAKPLEHVSPVGMASERSERAKKQWPLSGKKLLGGDHRY